MNGSKRMPGRERLKGVVYTLAAFLTWGFLPIYWKLLKEAGPFEILSHRIVWSFIFVLLVLAWRRNTGFLKPLRERRNLLVLSTTSVLVGANWFIYIMAVNSDRILEASMGYYINPLISILLGVTFLRERLDRLQTAALVLAVAGVAFIAIDYGSFPWIAVSLALLFGFYGLLKKRSNVDPMQALGVETMLLTPIALGYLLFMGAVGKGSFIGSGLVITLLLAFAGVVTTLPLYWFAEGARRINLSSVGFMQYIAPSMMLLLGIFIYGEDFTTTHIISFGLIWTALGLYSVSLAKGFRRPGRGA